MRRAERLFRLVNEMRTQGVARAADLAHAFEVSPSTIYRDIAHLQASGLPIDGEPGVGYMLRPGFDLPNVTFTHDQIDALAVGLAFVERTGDPALAAAAREVRAKLQAGLPDPEARVLSDAPYFSLQPTDQSPNLPLLRAAIRDRQVVEICYADASGTATRRRIRPLMITTLGQGWMVSSWCDMRQGFRSFRSDRIIELTVTKDIFPQDDDKGLRAFFAQEACEP